MRNSAFLAIAAVGGLVGANIHAQGPVYSVNIVGFQKVTSSNQFTQCSNPFVQPSHAIGQVVGTNLTGGVDFDTGDNVYTWTGTQYNRYFLGGGIGDPALDGKWLDENVEEATETIPPGKGFWVVNRNAPDTFTMVGDVVSAPTFSVTINPGFNMVSYPYSTSASINSTQFNMVAGFTGGVDFDTADTIFVWNGSQYIRYFLGGGTGDPAIDGIWLDENVEASTAVVQPGQGFWVKRVGAAVTWTVSKPY